MSTATGQPADSAYADPAFATLNDQYDRYERQVIARLLKRVTPRERIPSPLAAARLIDLIVPTVATWTALHPEDARGVKEATVDMVHRYLAVDAPDPEA